MKKERNGLPVNAGEKIKKSTKGIVLWAVELLLVCMTAVFLVAAFGQRVNVIGDSMSPVLKNGNVVMINHFIYNIKDPLRGDIAAFQKTETSGIL